MKFSHELTENQSSKTVGGRLKFSEPTTEYQFIYDLHSFRQMLTEIGNFRQILTDIFLAVIWLHVALVEAMAGDIPGQKTDDSARAVMDVTPWWAACRADRTSLRSVGGMTTRSL